MLCGFFLNLVWNYCIGCIILHFSSYLSNSFYNCLSCLGLVNWNLHTSTDRKAKEAYNKNTLIKDAAYELYFYDTYFIYTFNSGMSKSKFQYNRLFEIIETKTNYYLMTVWNNGIIICKSDCPKEFYSFINEIKSSPVIMQVRVIINMEQIHTIRNAVFS